MKRICDERNRHCAFCMYYTEIGAITNKPQIEFIGICNFEEKFKDKRLVSKIGTACSKFLCRVCLEKELL